MSNSVRSLADVDTTFLSDHRVLCLYSGGLDGTFLLSHIRSLDPGARVAALSVDLGGGSDHGRAAQMCSKLHVEHIVVDRTPEFVCDYVFPAIAAQASYMGTHPISASLSRPLMAQTAVQIARERGYDVILHTADDTQNSLRRFNQAFADLRYPGVYGSPYAHQPPAREKKLLALQTAGLAAANGSIYSTDVNIWCREFEAAGLDDPEAFDPPESLYLWSRPRGTAPSHTEVEVRFSAGVPAAVDGEDMAGPTLLRHLNAQVGQYGLGRYVGLEEIASGQKVQEVREMPAAHLLLDAYRRLEQATVPASCIREKMHLEQVWVNEAVEGRWLGELRGAADAFIASVAAHVSGRVRYLLTPNSMQVRSIVADSPRYIRDRGAISPGGG